MSKLPQISGREFIRALEKIGFYIVRQSGSHVILRRDNPYARLVVPNHKTLKKGMLHHLVDEAGLTDDEFIALL